MLQAYIIFHDRLEVSEVEEEAIVGRNRYTLEPGVRMLWEVEVARSAGAAIKQAAKTLGINEQTNCLCRK